MINLEEQAYLIHRTAVEKGFWEDDSSPNAILAKLALVHSEVSEILEAYRKEQGSHKIAYEFADTIIRILDIWQALKDAKVIEKTAQLEHYVDLKVQENKRRPRLHGNLM